MELSVRKVSISELEASRGFSELVAEYELLAIKGMPPPRVKIESYKTLEKIGIITPFAAFVGDLLVGFMNVVLAPSGHYSLRVALSESYFVAEKYRSTGAGNRLREMCEKYAKEQGSPGFGIAAPVDGPLARVLPRSGYDLAYVYFFKGFGDE
jgi:GNAT superfamily N-acetyltransferase